MARTPIDVVNPVLKKGIHQMTSPFGMRNGKMHNGIDLIGNGTTDYIIAFADGTVKSMLNTCSGKTPSQGNNVVIDHGNGVQTVYYHLKKGTVTVKAGQTVKAGDVIGYMGNTGNSTGAHLHFGIKIDNKWVDPKPYLEGEKRICIEKANSEIETKNSEDGGDCTYIVKSGDTLTKIASLYGVHYKDIAEYNKISNPNVINVGQIIKIPNRTYIVTKGDTLWKIAKKLLGAGDRYKEIKNLNKLKSDTIYSGQVLSIPKE